MSDEPEAEMSDGKVPQIGDEVLWKEVGDEDDEETYTESYITEVGELDDDTGMYHVETDDGPFEVYWSEADGCWVDKETN